MTTLQEILENFQAYVLDKDTQITQTIMGPDQAFRETRMNVYYEGYALRLLELLCKNFGALHILAGDELFERFGRDYISSHPSHHFSIRYFGQHFSEFLATHPESEPIFSEVAAFEWALEQAMDAPDAPHLCFEDLAKLPPEAWGNLTLKTHPSLQIIEFSYPTPTLVSAIQKDEDRPTLTRVEPSTPWLIWRFNLKALFQSLSAEQQQMMQAIQSGQTFAEICDALCQIMEEEKVVSFAAENLRRWISEGIFSEFRV